MKLETKKKRKRKLKIVLNFGVVLYLWSHLSFSYTNFKAFVFSQWKLFVGDIRALKEDKVRVKVNF